MAPIQEHHLNRFDLPAVWVAVLVDFFGKFPWPGVAAFLASVYTLFRLVSMVRKWWRSR